jgi:hypothetical protein
MREVHLKWSRWFDELTSPNGQRYVRMKRVSAAREAQFPRELRRVYQQSGAVGLVKHVKARDGSQLADAWAAVKRMFND